MSERRRRKGPGLVLSLGVMGVCFVLCAVFIGRGFGQLAHGLFDPVRPQGGTIVLDAGKGTYDVFQREGTSSLRAGDVTVTGPGGGTVATRATTSFETYTANGTVYRATISFQAERAGTYRVRVPETADVFAKRAAFDALGASITNIGFAALAGLGLALGIIMLVAGIVRRSHDGPPPEVAVTDAAPAYTPAFTGGVPPAPTAPGWYPDPWRQAEWRYHDGHQWTGHTG